MIQQRLRVFQMTECHDCMGSLRPEYDYYKLARLVFCHRQVTCANGHIKFQSSWMSSSEHLPGTFQCALVVWNHMSTPASENSNPCLSTVFISDCISRVEVQTTVFWQTRTALAYSRILLIAKFEYILQFFTTHGNSIQQPRVA